MIKPLTSCAVIIITCLFGAAIFLTHSFSRMNRQSETKHRCDFCMRAMHESGFIPGKNRRIYNESVEADTEQKWATLKCDNFFCERVATAPGSAGGEHLCYARQSPPQECEGGVRPERKMKTDGWRREASERLCYNRLVQAPILHPRDHAPSAALNPAAAKQTLVVALGSARGGTEAYHTLLERLVRWLPDPQPQSVL